MYFIIYKTTNLINHKFYVGFHATEDVNDNYLGSGNLIVKAIEKYGKENFKKEILYIFPTKNEALLKEAEIVDYDFIHREDTYNFKLGGEGGWDHIPRMIKEDKEFRKKMYDKISKSIKQAHKDGKLEGWNKTSSRMQGKHHSIKTKQQISNNNGNKLSIQEIDSRIKEIREIEKTRGWIGILAKKWNVSHTQVRRFVNKHSGCISVG